MARCKDRVGEWAEVMSLPSDGLSTVYGVFVSE
jgi:hypothetical protein